MTASYSFAWRTSFRFVRWFPPLISLGVMVFFLISPFPFRAVEIAVPLIAGLHAAFLFAPDDEPALELLLAAPRPLWRLLAERVLLLLALHLPVGVAGTLIVMLMEDISLTAALLRWLPPLVLLIGFGVYGGLLWRRSNTAALMIVMLVFATLIGGDALISRYNDLYPLHPYFLGALPDPLAFGARITDTYTINRLVVTLIGLALLARCGWIVRQDERLLGIR